MYLHRVLKNIMNKIMHVAILIIIIGCIGCSSSSSGGDSSNGLMMLMMFMFGNGKQAAEPVFSPTGGTFHNNISVIIKCPTAGASIYYTIDGNDPTTASTLYFAPVPVNDIGTVMTIKAIAVLEDKSYSKIVSATYTISYTIDYSRIMISEVFYDAVGSDDGREFIELYNDNDYPCDISGMMVVDGTSMNRDFIFPPGSVIGSKSYVVVAQSSDGFYYYFGRSADYGNFSFSLNNSGETVLLKKSDGSILDAVYIKGGTEDFIPPESWGSATQPAALAGESVFRINANVPSTSTDWSSGPPTPGL